MSTYMAKPETVQRSWYIIDAAGKPLGKTAVTAANILRGKEAAVVDSFNSIEIQVSILSSDL